MLTQEELKEVFNYNPDTGIFVWKISRGGKTKVGDIAGCNEAKGYWCIRYKKSYKAHRLAWLYVYGRFPNGQIDHIDGDKSNNRINNLRECCQSENQRNVLIRKDSTSGFKGVNQDKQTGRWRVRAQLHGKRRFLGSYTTPEEASKVYEAFTREHHKEFYRDTTQ